MRRLFLILFLISLVVTGIETFRPEAPFPAVNGVPGAQESAG